MKAQHFHTKLPYKKPNWGVKNELITKNGLLPFLLSFKKKLI